MNLVGKAWKGNKRNNLSKMRVLLAKPHQHGSPIGIILLAVFTWTLHNFLNYPD